MQFVISGIAINHLLRWKSWCFPQEVMEFIFVPFELAYDRELLVAQVLLAASLASLVHLPTNVTACQLTLSHVGIDVALS